MHPLRLKENNIDEYIVNFPLQSQKILKQLRDFINNLKSDLTETISYQIPIFKFKGKNLVHFAAFKSHIGFYPGPSAIVHFETELTPYQTAKGSIQFPLNKPINFDLIEKIINFRVRENMEKYKTKTSRLNSENLGTFLKYHKDGTLWAKGNIKDDGQMDGYWEWFRKDGTKLRSGFFVNGTKTGEWITYDKAGKPYKISKIKAV